MTGIVVPYHLDEYLPDLDAPIGADKAVSLKLPEGGAWERMAALYDRVAEVVAEAIGGGARPVVASGDCTTALGTVAGLQRAVGDLSVVWFDAHGDLNTEEASPSGYIGGTPLRTLVGDGEPTVPAALGLRPVPEERVLLVDGRDLDPPEAAYLEGAKIRRRDVASLATANAGPLPPGPIYLHIDFDVVDADDLPGLKFPVSPGPKLASVMAAAREVLATGRVAAVGLGCTWYPSGGSADVLRPHLAELLA
jgi:arginase